jgi:adenylyltransferase/sulfurtransferase
LSRNEIEHGGRIPTTPTVSSIIAGVQCQEAVKLLHGMKTLAGGAWVFNGVSADAYVTAFQRKADCFSHDVLDEVIALDAGVSEISAAQILSQAKDALGPDVRLELAREMLEKLICPACGLEEAVFASLGKVAADRAWCPRCRDGGPDGRGVRREVITFHEIKGSEVWVNDPLSAIGVPPFDLVIARGNGRSIGFELSGDAQAVLGPLVSGAEALDLA